MIEIQIRDSETGLRNITAIEKAMVMDEPIFKTWVEQRLAFQIRDLVRTVEDQEKSESV